MSDGIAPPNSEVLLAIIDEPDIERGLKRVCELLDFKHAVYHLAQNVNLKIDLPYLKSTYPSEWLGHYLHRTYYLIDPVVTAGFAADKPFLWSELRSGKPEQEAFFADAEAHGVGNCGYTIPIVDRSGRRAAFSVTGQDSKDSWAGRVEWLDFTLQELAQLFHRRALVDLYGGQNIPSLSPRELECLSWTTQGKDASTIAAILEISEHTVRDYLKSARQKLGCATIAQAVYHATRLRLINP
ncbi:MAG: LuxR family transcriptional regulator [Pseudomonadota bacterium]|nr:LuxR family transcriptional regulator [Pseudomonadota bacterium]